MDKALILQSIAIVEVLTGYGDIPHVYFLCEMWGNTRCVNVVGCYGSRLIGAVACTNTIYHKPNKVKQ